VVFTEVSAVFVYETQSRFCPLPPFDFALVGRGKAGGGGPGAPLVIFEILPLELAGHEAEVALVGPGQAREVHCGEKMGERVQADTSNLVR
jgi:hypothetical protein